MTSIGSAKAIDSSRADDDVLDALHEGAAVIVRTAGHARDSGAAEAVDAAAAHGVGVEVEQQIDAVRRDAQTLDHRRARGFRPSASR